MRRRQFLKLGAVLTAACLTPWSVAPPSLPPRLSREIMFAFGPGGQGYEIRPAEAELCRTGHWRRRAPAWNYPVHLAFGDDRLYLADRGCGIHLLDAAGRHLGTFGEPVQDLAVDPWDARLFASSQGRIDVFQPDGRRAGSFSQRLHFPRGLAFSPAGELHVVDAGSLQVEVFSRRGRHLGNYGRFEAPRALRFDSRGRWVVADAAAASLCWSDRREKLPQAPLALAFGADDRLYVTVT